MNLDNLHKVMKGDMTIDQACEGMTDDYEIGHVSHRADGDYRKVAQGKWVPVKAGGQGQMGAKAQSAEKQARSLHSLNQQMGLGGKATGEEAESIREELTERDRQAPAAKTEDILKTSTAQTIKRSRNGVTDDDVVRFFNEEIKGRGNGTDAHALRIFGNTSQMMTQFDQWYKREKSRKAEQKGKDQNKNVLTSADDVNWDIIEQVYKEAYKANKTHGTIEMIENYDITQIQKFANANVDTDFDNVDGIQGYLKKKAALPGGVDLNVAAKELAKFTNWQNARAIWRNYENKELAVDDTGHFYVPESARPKAEGGQGQNMQGDIQDAAPRLTRDTKIKLSQVKR